MKQPTPNALAALRRQIDIDIAAGRDWTAYTYVANRLMSAGLASGLLLIRDDVLTHRDTGKPVRLYDESGAL